MARRKLSQRAREAVRREMKRMLGNDHGIPRRLRIEGEAKVNHISKTSEEKLANLES